MTVMGSCPIMDSQDICPLRDAVGRAVRNLCCDELLCMIASRYNTSKLWRTQQLALVHAPRAWTRDAALAPWL